MVVADASWDCSSSGSPFSSSPSSLLGSSMISILLTNNDGDLGGVWGPSPRVRWITSTSKESDPLHFSASNSADKFRLGSFGCLNLFSKVTSWFSSLLLSSSSLSLVRLTSTLVEFNRFRRRCADAFSLTCRSNLSARSIRSKSSSSSVVSRCDDDDEADDEADFFSSMRAGRSSVSKFSSPLSGCSKNKCILFSKK